jgi:cytochrome P450
MVTFARRRWSTRQRPRPLPPGPRGYPWLGVLPQMRRDSLGFLSAMVRTYGDIVALPFGPVRIYLLCHPEQVAYVLQGHAHNYGKSRFSAQVRPLLGQGLATSDGALWRTQRRLVQPAFHRERLAGLAETITTATHAMLARWAPHAATGTPLDMLAEMTRLTGEVIVRALFGTALPEAVGRTMFADFATVTGYLRRHMLTLTPWGAWLPTPGRRQFHAALARLDHLVGQHIQARRQQGGDHGDLLALLLAARDPATGAGMAPQQLRDEVMTLLFAGHETTALALTWTWDLLARHPAVAERLRRDVAAVLAGRMPTVADLPHLPYLRMVLEEALRLYPPAWMIARAARADDVIGGYPIPAGTTVFLSPYLTHRHPDVWPEPERFDPERFGAERAAARPPGAYFPFAAGPRACLGAPLAMLEAQLIVAQVIQAYDVALVGGQPVVPQPRLTLRPRHGVPMVVRGRPAAAAVAGAVWT